MTEKAFETWIALHDTKLKQHRNSNFRMGKCTSSICIPTSQKQYFIGSISCISYDFLQYFCTYSSKFGDSLKKIPIVSENSIAYLTYARMFIL